MITKHDIDTIMQVNPNVSSLSKPFWVIWSIELWERFGYYGVQAILALYFVQQLGYSENQSFYIFGSFSAFVFGFAWIGGWIGDQYFGAKRTLVLGAIILAMSYSALAMASHSTVFYALSGIVIGNALFKVNPSSLIAKMYEKGNLAFDSAMTLYYMAVNVGSMFSMAVTPIVAQYYGWSSAFWICAIGLLCGLGNYRMYNHLLKHLNSEADKETFSIKKLGLILVCCLIAFLAIAILLSHTFICNVLIVLVVSAAFVLFLKRALMLKGSERTRMLVTLILVLQGVVFFVLYNQMPTSLTFFAMHNVHNVFLGWHIPPAEYQVLNSIVVVVMSPILAWAYQRYQATHVTKFCLGMSLCALAFLVLALPQYLSSTGFISPLWMLLTYFLQSTGELLIAGLGLAMVAELCPAEMCGFVMGFWFLTCMLAGPLGAWVGALTTAPHAYHDISPLNNLHLYGNAFAKIGLVTGLIAAIMWFFRGTLNQAIRQ